MLKRVAGITAAALLTAGVLAAAEPDGTVVVTSSNTSDNRLLVYDTAGTLVQEVPTFGQGGASQNAGGIATRNGVVALANFGSQTVSLFSRGEGGFELRQTIPASSQPVSVAFGERHLYVLGTTTVESHRIRPDGVEAAPDGTAGLLFADGSAAQLGVVADELLVTEKSGAIERVQLRQGAVVGDGAPQQIIEQYMSEALRAAGTSLADRQDRYTQGELMIRAVEFRDEKGEPIQHVFSGQHLVVRVYFHSHVSKVFKDQRVAVVFNRDERVCCILSTDLVDRRPLDLEGSGYVEFHVPHLPLCGGRYFLHVAIENNALTQDWVQYAAELQVLDGDYYGTGRMYPHEGWRGKGMFIKHSWNLERHSPRRVPAVCLSNSLHTIKSDPILHPVMRRQFKPGS